ncbi:hypothetical protein [Flagellimonas allohymeniacidonis]|uniref:Uncharacterized protein n=1 Tax=Flagellimonas allohymeniacidonis TaxID=2517819 RepID=A0A4Q8QL71_9FLAO|nr:hypothetical protein [Allomuricauda hymeniacidonis]TAI48996.1 hypothetical protein EW142_04155 [Allomuricauda hymeniacidonis]
MGGDGLIATFATIRAYKKDVVLKKVGKKGPVAMLRELTGLSRTTIEKHLPILLEIGLLEIHNNGNIAVHGRKWSSNNLPCLHRRKLIPIKVYDKFIDTKTYCAFVRVHSRLGKQERQIGKKAKRIEVLEACSRNERLSKGDYRIWKKLYRQGITLEELKSKFRSKSTLSNLAFHKILKDTDIPSNCNESSGKDFKSKLIMLGLIKQSRLFELVLPGIKDKEFVLRENDLLHFGGLFQGSLGIYHERSPEIVINNALVGAEKKQVVK